MKSPTIEIYVYVIPKTKLRTFLEIYKERVYYSPTEMTYFSKESRLFGGTLSLESELLDKKIPFYRTIVRLSLEEFHKYIIQPYYTKSGGLVEKYGEVRPMYGYDLVKATCKEVGIPENEFLPIFYHVNELNGNPWTVWINYIVQTAFNTSKLRNHVEKMEDLVVLATPVPKDEVDPAPFENPRSSEYMHLIPLSIPLIVITLTLITQILKK